MTLCDARLNERAGNTDAIFICRVKEYKMSNNKTNY